MDIHQQLQENSLSQIKLPRDISSSDIPSKPNSTASSPRLEHRLSPKPVIRNTQQNPSDMQKGQTNGPKRGQQNVPLVNAKAALVKSLLPAMPKLNKPTGGNMDLSVPKLNIKSLRSLNLVSKLKTTRADASRLLSKVPGSAIFYKNGKDIDGGVDEPDIFIEIENDMATPEFRTHEDRKRTFSKDDSSLDESFEVSETDLKKEVVLDSCGILATSAKQILESPQYSVDEPDDGIEESREEVTQSVSEPDLDKNQVKDEKIVFDICESHQDEDNEKNEESVKNNEAKTNEIARKGSNASFKCFCVNTDECPHNTMQESEEVWVRRTDVREEKPPMSLDLDLGQKRVIDNSEADKILAKYSKAKKALSHPNMRNSMSDSAISANQITVAFTNVEDESPKSVLEWNFEVNSQLQKKLPNLLQSAKMPRKAHRIYENLKQHIENQLGDQICQSTIIFI